MDIYELIAKICKKIKNQPSYLGLLLLDILATIICFPKYLYYLIGRRKTVAFDWGDGTYSEFFLPLAEKLDKRGLRIIFFFRFGYANPSGLNILKKGLPRIYGDFLDNKVVICASSSKYEKLPKTVRIQIFHGLSSFGSVWQRDFIDYFDVLFLVTKFQWQQLQEGYKKIIEGKEIFKIGYPKIDRYISMEKEGKNTNFGDITLFYGPTYHAEISSIFEFLSPIVEICQRNSYRLVIKLHPFLYYKYNYNMSGGIDRSKKIYEYKKNYDDIVFLRGDKGNLGDYFRMANVFLTDVSGIGFEFVLTTAKAIIFLGDKLKVPLEDLRKGDIRKYSNYSEIYYRGKIGPVVREPQKLEKIVKETIVKDNYKTEREKFRQEYVFNLGTSTDVAVSKIKEIYERLS